MLLRKAAAALLLILIASPFTAPFETCDVLTLFGSHAPTAQCQYQVPFASTEDQSQAVAVASASRRVRHRSRFATPTATDPLLERSAPVVGIVRDPAALPPAFALAGTSHTPLRI